MRISDWSSDVCASDLNRKVRGNIRSFDGWRAKRWPSRPCATAAGAGSGAGCGGLARCLLARGGALGGLRGLGGLRRGLLLRGSVLADGRLAHRRLARAGPAGGRSALAAQFGGQLLDAVAQVGEVRSEEHTSELHSLMRTSYAGFCLKK